MKYSDQPLYTVTEDDIDWGLDIAAALAIILHGVVDVAVTAAAWELERNGIVLLLGPRVWVFVKIVVLVLAVLVWWYTREGLFERDLTMFFFGAWTGLGVTVIVLNMVALGWL